ncbi:hypothetical protein DI487_11055 [Flavobacterium sediminis]|uniref:THIF-type NAD/FAD binding fold domain-containing protein n=1 Tax=Flavobacterium sediminis TaxID=2201181 RepID=A0A2U8QVZ7_9FLAO|nr:ThiF family adenylyltransferase [Flavobacterium sediminis]AWM14338.1 hypothetical protein DI487_11055 [Flavobacterium sediminis]
MDNRLRIIDETFKKDIYNLIVREGFEVVDSFIIGKIELISDVKSNVLFDVRVEAIYPLKLGNSESISFTNVDLKKYSHINPDGSVCFHSLSSPDLEYKLDNDIKALLEWFHEYYELEMDDKHFEYPFYSKLNEKNVFLFCDSDFTPKKDDFGFFYYTKGYSTEKNNYLIQGLKNQNDFSKIRFLWSNYYGNFKNSLKGIYLILEKAPVYHRNFSFNKWTDFKTLFSASFLKFINDSKKKLEKKDLIEGKFFVLLLGYPIYDNKINYEIILIDYYNLPVYKGDLVDSDIIWAKAVDSSYDIFFGRGKLHNSLTESKILVLGVGAIGSNLAESLVRGGCKNVSLFDHDIKEIGNICRAKYNFFSGESFKVDELALLLTSISPFVEIKKYRNVILPLLTDELKKNYLEVFDRYDYIFNCTASNDVNIIIDDLPIKSQLLTLSISNNANDLVCIIGNGNVYQTNSKIYNEINQDLNDLFNPQGCWNPTFKASFHNINALLNFALSNIDYKLKKGLELKTFMLDVNERENYTIKLKD